MIQLTAVEWLAVGGGAASLAAMILVPSFAAASRPKKALHFSLCVLAMTAAVLALVQL